MEIRTFPRNCVFNLAAILILAQGSFAETSKKINLQIEQNPQKKIKGLTFDQGIEVQQRVHNSKIELYVPLRGSFNREDYSLLINNVPVPESQHSSFKKDILIKGPSEGVTFSAIGPKGDLETERVILLVPQFQSIREDVLSSQTQKKLHFSASLGPSLVNFTQTDLSTDTSQKYNQTFLTLRFNAVYLLSKLWELSANTFYNVYKIKSNMTDSVPFLGFNARAGYVLTPSHPKWKLIMNAGWYYVTTMGTNVGFQNLSGPQVFPLVRYNIGEAKSVFGYFKFSPISNKFSFLSFSNREIAYGGGYSFPALGRSFTLGLDLSNIALNLDEIGTSSNSITISLGTSLF